MFNKLEIIIFLILKNIKAYKMIFLKKSLIKRKNYYYINFGINIYS